MTTCPNPKFFATLLATGVVFGASLNYFAYTRLQSGESHLDSLKKDQSAARQIPLKLKDSADRLASTQDELKHLASGIPDIAYMPTMLKELETLGNSCGMQVTAVRPAAPKEDKTKAKDGADKPYQPIDIEVHAVGHYGDALRFIRALDTFPKVVCARAVSLDPQTGKAKTTVGRPLLNMIIQLRAFVFKPATTRTAMNGKEDNHA